MHIFLRQRETGLAGAGAFGEQAQRLVRSKFWQRLLGLWRQAQRRHAISDFTHQPERLATGYQDGQISAAAQKRISQPRAAFKQVLAVVQYQQSIARLEVSDQEFFNAPL